MAELTTTKQIIEALGGIDDVARLTGRNSDAVWNWDRRSETFPANTFVAMQRALKERGHTAPVSLWRMVEAAQ